MIAAIVRFAIRFPGVVLAVAALVVLYGAWLVAGADLDVFPEFSPNLVVVQTEAPGFTAELVESQVTQPIERGIAGISELASMRSESIAGLSVVTLVFDEAANIFRSRQAVSERLVLLAGRLPQGVAPPGMTPHESSTAAVLGIGITSKTRSLGELRSFVDGTLKPALLGAPGVADVNVFGGDVRQWQIQLDPRKLLRYRLSVNEVAETARRATGVRGAGFVENENQRILLQTASQPADVADLARVPVAHREGRTLTLGELGHVLEAPAPAISAAAIDGTPGVFMLVQAQYGSRVLAVTRAAERVLADLAPVMRERGIELYPRLFRPANFIQTAVRNIRGDVLIGAALVVAVLIGFLFNLRTALISAVAIPLSLLTAMVVMLRSGMTLNVMALGGLAIAIGEVVDDAVIDMENIYRRLRENRELSAPRLEAQVVHSASLEVRGSVVYATFVIALVFYPLLELGGVAGKLFAPLGIAYILAILASLLVAMTVTPALCLLLLGRGALPRTEPPLVRRLLPRYRRMLEAIERRPNAVLAGAALLVCASIGVLPFLRGEFLPELREGHYVVHMTSAPGTALTEALRAGRSVSAAISAVRGVKSVGLWVGRAPAGADTAGPHYGELEVELVPLTADEQERVLDDIRRALGNVRSGIPGLVFAVNTFLTERIDETLSGFAADFVATVYGSDLDALDRDAAAVARALRGVPGARDVQLQAAPGIPELAIRPRAERLRQWGIAPLELSDTVQAAYGDLQVGQVFQSGLLVGVSVLLDPAERRDIGRVGALLVKNSEGRFVRLDELADLRLETGRYSILHADGRRVQTVTANIAGRDPEAFEADAQQRIASQVKFASGDYLSIGGTARAQARARHELLLHAAIALVAILAVLYLAFRSARNMMVALANLPFALVGGVIAALASGGWMSLGSLVGFVTLFGITLRNSIMLVSHCQHLVEVDGLPWDAATAVRAACERLPAILMTALVTLLGLLPLALASGEPGREIEGPMATVIVGGLVSSTLLNLVLLPVLLRRFGRFLPRPVI